VSTTFLTGGEAIWSPSNQVARLFVGQAEVIASVFATPSGLGDVVEDECQVDPPTFATFLTEIVRRTRPPPIPSCVP
jgi:hypothetical protein